MDKYTYEVETLEIMGDLNERPIKIVLSVFETKTEDDESETRWLGMFSLNLREED